MTHDPLCPWDEASGSSEGLSKYACECTLIARVRENERANAKWVPKTVADEMYAKGQRDERQRSATLIGDAYGRGYLKGKQDEREACIAAVENQRVPWPTATGDLVNEGIDEALAAIDTLRGDA